tara:strand:- start:2098 stop:3399 length:1302 start_codon:yes stop_codon:yes gene_type:complete
MSTINTNGINVNYPVPGENNSSQGFRDNFTNIKNNINTAGEEITELQSKAVLKAGLTGIPIDNNMANTLISNAAVRSFRSTTYNLGNAISGSVVIDATLGDVQIGTITGNTTVQLAGWAPSGTRSAISLDFTIANTEAYVIFPGTVNASGNIIENNTLVGGNLAIATAPYSVTNLKYELATTNCGNTVTINPLNRPYQTSQIETRQAITPTGYQGDRNGDIAVAPAIEPITVTATTVTTNVFTTDSTLGFYIGMPIQFTAQGGDVIFGGPVAGTTYYVSTITADTSFIVTTDAALTTPLTLSTDTGTMQASPIAYTYICVGTFDSNVTTGNLSAVASNVITVGATSIANTAWANQPVIFSGANVINANLIANTPYYVKTAPSTTTLTVSKTRVAGGVAGPTVELADTVSLSGVVATIYVQGHDIWKRIQLDSF